MTARNGIDAKDCEGASETLICKRNICILMSQLNLQRAFFKTEGGK